MWDKIKETIRVVAPTTARALGGPLAGTAVKSLANKLLGNPDASESEVAEYISSGLTGEDLAALKEVENDFKVRMRELGIKERQLDVDDRVSAREMFTVRKYPQVVLSALFSSGFFATLYFIFTQAGQVEMSGAGHMVVGMLIAGMTQILNFWFGSSNGSSDKTAALVDQAKRNGAGK